MRLVLTLLGDDASLLGEGEGALEPDELRLRAFCLAPGRALKLDDGTQLSTADGDIELVNAFRTSLAPPTRCLLRWNPTEGGRNECQDDVDEASVDGDGQER